ncbi:MAG: hypothetical protein E7020_06670 [Alphaproteobacteria bacterium]|nr:hypothetical protein [Alphaproteobacteria bacterium]
MIKAFLVSFLIGGIFYLCYITDLFAILSHKAFTYIAFTLAGVMLIVAKIVLNNSVAKDQKDEKSDE